MYDVIIIGSGIIGSAIARNLSKYKLDTLVLEKENDVSDGTTKANSSIAHAGYDAEPGSLKAKFNVLGSQMMEELCNELYVPYKNIGSLVVGFDEKDEEVLKELYEKGIKNGVKDLQLLNKEETLKIEKNISKDITSSLYAPTGAVIGPWELSIAMLENAMDNGVKLKLNQKVIDINKEEYGFLVKTETDSFKTKYVINAAGLYADEIHNLVSKPKFKITPRRGQYLLFDKYAGKHVNTVVFQCPTPLGKGVVVLPTVHGNLLVGPDAEDIKDKFDLDTTSENIKKIMDSANKGVEELDFSKVITSFSGLRAHSDVGDFIIEEVEDAKGFIDVSGIESPGLTAAPAIGEYVSEMLKDIDGNFEENKDFNPKRREPIVFMDLSNDEKKELIKKDKKYGRIICRCENITEGEIVDIIHRNAGATTIDGVKRRARPGSGRCQGGFCQPKVMEILARELNIDITQVKKDKPNSKVAISKTK